MPPIEPVESTYTLSVTGVTPDAAVVSVTPSNATERYWVDAIEKTQYDSQCSGTPEGLKNYMPALMAARAQAAGKTISELIAAEGKVGNATKNFQNLNAETDHIAFAIAVDANGNGTSAAKVEAFKTLAAAVEGPAYVVTVTDVTPTTAKLNAVPENKTEVYWLDYMEQADYASLGGTPEGVAAYVPTLMQALVEAGFSMETILDILGSVGDDSSEVDELDPETEYIAYAVGVNVQGQVTNVPVVTPFTTAPATGTAPVVTLSLTPGDEAGADKQTKITINAKSSDVASFKYGLFDNADVLPLINGGKTYEYIVDTFGDSGDTADITAINSAAGFGVTFINLDPETEYCLIVKATGSGGLSTTEHAEKATDPAGEASEAYKAWLGTWTVTSASSMVNKAPVTFELVISQKVANTTYSATGWGITGVRDIPAAAITLKFDAVAETFFIPNEQTFGRDETPPAGTNAFCLGVPYGTGYVTVTGAGVPGITATLSADKQTANAIGNVVNIGGTNYTTAYMDYCFLGDDDKVYAFDPAPGYTIRDYAIVPLTMTKKSTTSTAAPHQGILPKAFALSREGRMVAATLNSGQATVTTENARVSKIDKSRMTDKASMRELMRRK